MKQLADEIEETVQVYERLIGKAATRTRNMIR